MKNTIIKGFDNEVVFVFEFTGAFAAGGLSNFNEIKVFIGSEEYSNVADPLNLEVTSNTELALRIGDTTALTEGFYYPKIVGYNVMYDDGFVLTSENYNQINPIRIA